MKRIILPFVTIAIVGFGLAAERAANGRDAPDVQSVATAIRTEASKANDGDDGRPLPLAGHWNNGRSPDGFSPAWQMKMIDKGHRLLPWFAMPSPESTMESRLVRWEKARDYFEAPMRRCAELRLPISLVATQWESLLYRDDEYFDLAAEENPCVVAAETGKIQRRVSPFGPAKWWREVGRRWTSSPAMKQLQKWHPDPPLVLFVSNNEAAKLLQRRPGGVEASRRYLDRHGKGRDRHYKEKVIVEGYAERYRALIDGMREGLVSPTWKKNAKFIGYGVKPGPEHFGRWGGWMAYSDYVPGQIASWPRVWDGGSGSYYTHDWSGITDYRVWSPQVESMNWAAFLDRETYKRHPNFWFEFSTWDGNGKPEKSKRKFYEKRGQTFTPARYGGMVQFGMWLTRPRVVREFRGYLETRQTREPYFLPIVEAIDRVHANSALRRFWRNGRLVANRAHRHPYQSAIPKEYRDLHRWFLLDTNLDPPRPWTQETEIPVFALARVAGDAPRREWLVYAHSPLGERKNVAITLPDCGPITVDVSVAGSFYMVDEESKGIRPAL